MSPLRSASAAVLSSGITTSLILEICGRGRKYFVLRDQRTSWRGTRDSNTYAPVPIGLLAKSAPYCSTALRLGTRHQRHATTASRKFWKGAFIVKRTVYLSGASTFVTGARSEIACELTLGSRRRSKWNLTSSDVSS